MSDHPLKELLQRLLENGDEPQVLHLQCSVEQDIASLRARLSDFPDPEKEESRVLQYGLDAIRRSAKSMLKAARKQELEIEMRLLDKPDEVDLESEEWEHARLHIEQEQLQAEALRREGKLMAKFADLVEGILDDDE